MSERTGGVKDSPLNRPFLWRVTIEGGSEAPDKETVRAMCLANISFTAGLGQMVGNIHVGVKEQSPEDLAKAQAAAHGIILKP